MRRLDHSLSHYIDHTLLKPEATKEQIDQLIDEAKKYEFTSVCLHPYWVSYCANRLKGFSTKVCTVIGFPLGANTTAAKVFETKQAIEDGAKEIDMVLNIGELKAGNNDVVYEDIRAVVQAANKKAIVKVIIETALLTEQEKINACQIIERAEAHFVKTSTGFSTHGAQIEDIKLLRKSVPSHIGVKASGGIRTRETVLKMIEAGANRIGASASVSIIS